MEDDILAEFSADGREARTKWYQNALTEITGREDEPAHETFFLADEAGRAYVNGLFIATIILCAAIVEQEIFGELVYREIYDADNRVHLPDMVDKAESGGILSSAEAEDVRDLNRNRIAFFHYREYQHEDDPFRRVSDNQEEPYWPHGEFEKWARDAIETWLTISMKPWTEWAESIDK